MSLEVLTMGGAGGESASIFVTGLSEGVSVSASKGGKVIEAVYTEGQGEVATQVPVMTSNTTPSGVASAKSMYTGNEAYYAFAGEPIANKQAHSVSGDSTGWWLAYDFGYEVKVTSFEIAPQYRSDYVFWERFPSVFTLQGSNDGSVWNDIESFEVPSSLLGSTENFQILSYDVSVPKTYSKFRVLWGDVSESYASCSYLQFYGTRKDSAFGHKISNIKEYGLWTVTATDAIPQNVVINAADEFQITMYVSPLYLYNYGDECKDVTGGWEAMSGMTAATKQANAIYTPSEPDCGLCTVNKIDLTPYTTLYARKKPVGSNVAHPIVTINTARDRTTEVGAVGVPTTSGESVVSANITNLTGDYYVACRDTATAGSGYVYQIWLE